MFRKNTDAIIAPLNKILRDLDANAKRLFSDAADKRANAAILSAGAVADEQDAERALRIAEKVAGIID
jgi:hypothetical protein